MPTSPASSTSTTKQWVKDGFFRKEAKGGLGWIDRDTVYVATDFGPGSMTESGYPRIAKEWKRGTPIESASVVYEGKPDRHVDQRGPRRHARLRARFRAAARIEFYNDELYLRGKDGKLTKVDVPNSAQKSVQREWLGLELRDPWEVGGKTYKAGSLHRHPLRRLHGRQARFRRAVRAQRHHLAGRRDADEDAARAQRARQRQEQAVPVQAWRRRLDVVAARRRRARLRHHQRRGGRCRRQRCGLDHRHRLPHPDHADARRTGQARRDRSAQDDAGVLRRVEGRDRTAFRHQRRTAPGSRTSWCGRRT